MVNRLVLAATASLMWRRRGQRWFLRTTRLEFKNLRAGGELFTTHHDVVNAIVDGLVAAGHPRNSIIVWDRSLGGIKGAGYRSGINGYQLKAIEPRDGYDPKATFSAPLIGKLILWGDFDYRSDKEMVMLSDTENTSNVSHFSKILSSEVTKIINVPVMSISETNGIAGCIYNATIPNFDNWRRFAQGSRFGAESLAEIYSNSLIAKSRFQFKDGLLAQYAAGRSRNRTTLCITHVVREQRSGGVGRDRVEKPRAMACARESTAYWLHGGLCRLASQLNLGNSAHNRIEIRNIGR